MTGRKVRVVFSVEADRDFDKVYIFTSERWGIEQADEYTSRLWETFETIARHPEIGKLRSRMGSDIRSFIVMEYAVWYRFEDDVVRILRITHERTNPEKIDFDV